jgi:hypothetical protein
MLLLFLSIAMAEPQFTNLEKGEPAPFKGRLFNDEGVAELIAKKHLSEAMCKAVVDKSVEVATAKVTYGCDVAIAEHEMLIRNLKTENEFLKKSSTKNKWVIPLATSAGGIAVGVGVTAVWVLANGR